MVGIPKTATYKVSSDVKFVQTSMVNSVRKLELKSLVYEVRHFIGKVATSFSIVCRTDLEVKSCRQMTPG